MFKLFIAKLRWGKLSQEQKEELKTLSLGQTLARPYLVPKLFKHY